MRTRVRRRRHLHVITSACFDRRERYPSFVPRPAAYDAPEDDEDEGGLATGLDLRDG